MKKLNFLFAALFTATVFNLSAATAGTTPDMHDFLYFVGLNGNDTVRLNKYASKDLANLTATFEYSKDRKTWKAYDTWATSADPANTYQGNPIALNQGDTVFFRAKGTNGKNATMSYAGATRYLFAFGVDDQIAAGGNIMSLYDATCEQDTMTASGFYYLFKDAKQLVSASELKLTATQLATYSYGSMFYGCTSLTQAPELKATTLADNSYSYMFQDCSSLTTAPALPATTLASSCYQKMFQGCSSLTKAPELNATTLAPVCYSGMFQGCSSLTKAPELDATTLARSCYSGMFRHCTSLTQAPELKATTLAQSCYSYMFQNCSSLQVDTCADGSCEGVKFEPTHSGTAPDYWNDNMFDGCKGTVTTPQLNGHYCIKEYVPACKIGDKEYSSIAAAVAEVKAGDTIQVLKDIQLDAMINVTSSTPAFTLDLNGHILDGSNLTGNNASLIRNEGTLSIIDSDPTATHEAPFDTIAGAIMTGGKGWKYGTNIYGGAIYSKNGTLNINGVAFVNNSATYGGAAWVDNTNSTFTNCRFYGNIDTDRGAAVGIDNNSQCSIDSCFIKGNSTTLGTIYAYKSSLTIAHTTITGNTSSTNCGAMYVLATSLTLNDGTVITNNTDGSAFPSGGAYVWTDATYKNSITLSGKVIIKDNTSNGQPANLCLSGNPVCDEITLNGLSEGSEVYISTLDKDDAPAPRSFVANATEADLQYFKSDDGYAFVLDKNGKIVAKEAYGRKVTNGNFGTICLDKQFIAMEGVEALYVPASKDANYLYCEPVEVKDVKAGYAYIFKANADSVTFALEGEAVTAAVEANSMLGWLEADKTIDNAFLTTYANYSLLGIPAGGTEQQIVKPTVGSEILKNRAMINLTTVQGGTPAPGRRCIKLGVNTPTGMNQLTDSPVNRFTKMMINGQLIIIREGRKFNAQGQEL